MPCLSPDLPWSAELGVGVWYCCAMRSLVLAGVLALMPVAASAEQLLKLASRPGVELRVLTDRPAGAPRGAVILLAGGDGVLSLDDGGQLGAIMGNHVIRTRALYARAGHAWFAPDIASDLKTHRGYRLSTEHARDLAAVVKAARAVGGPVVAIGTSRGALSVASLLVKQTEALPDAAVISSGVLMADRDRNGFAASAAGDLGRVRAPVLLLRHSGEACSATPASDADRFKALLSGSPRVDIVTFDGGQPRGANADPCGPWHYHGFPGIEAEVVTRTVEWIAANVRR